MARDEARKAAKAKAEAPRCIETPQISITGVIDEDKVRSFLDQLKSAEKAGGDVAMDLTTLGGDAEMARRFVLEIDRARKRLAIPGRRFSFLGKTVVYSAGVTIMCAFPNEDRWLTGDAVLLIHCRQLDKTIKIEGPMRASVAEVDALRAQIENGLRLEDAHFERLIGGSDISLEELREKALYNWYLTAEQALERGLVAGIV